MFEGFVLTVQFAVLRFTPEGLDEEVADYAGQSSHALSQLLRVADGGNLLSEESLKQVGHSLTPPRGRGKRQWDDLPALQAEVQTILKKHGVESLLEVTYRQEVERRPIRKYGDRPARTEEQVRYVVQVQRNREVIAAARCPLGWRLYATNAPAEELSLTEAVWAYRGAPRMERDFRQLKGHPLGIRPLYVQREDHALGLAHLLSLALRVLTLVEHVVREALQAAGDTLRGL